jgi:alpha-methylacyl-CoA racemase
MTGPLKGLRLIEIVGIGPAPFAAMLLADLGAEVIRVDRATGRGPMSGSGGPFDFLGRNRRSIAVDLKHAAGAETVLRLAEHADGLIEGFRPGVAERLGIGPDDCFARNQALVYGRMTGWGQEGPLASEVGHDLNYLALTGVLHGIGAEGGPPVPPLNVVGDFGGGGLWLAFGMLAALHERRESGRGQVIDAAMIDGASALGATIHGVSQMGYWREERGTNLLDGGAHFYGCYETRDGKWMSVGALEPQFYAELLSCLGLGEEDLPDQMDQSAWPAMKERFAAIFETRTRDEWCDVFAGREVCAAPVLTMPEALEHPHHEARGTFVPFEGARPPAPGPRFSRTPGALRSVAANPGEHTDEVLADWGFSADELRQLRADGAIS